MPDADKVFAVIDTNVIVSSFLSKDGTSYPAQVISAILKGDIVPLYNDEILAEYQEVLYRPKFPFTKMQVDTIVSAFKDYGNKVIRVSVEEESFPDPDDIVFYEVKMSKEDAYLVTGNIKHFPKKPLVVTPKEMVEILERKNIIRDESLQ